MNAQCLERPPDLNMFFFHITQQCNLKCRHCWIDPVHSSNGDVNGREISIETTKSLVEQAIPLGLKRVKITGGEPFLRKDILHFIEFFRSKDLSVSLETNGTLLYEETVKALKDLDVSVVAVSLDGIRPGSHDSLRGVQGAFDRAVRGIKFLRKYNVTFDIVSVLHRRNLVEIIELLAFADSQGARTHKINPISAVGRGKGMSDKGDLLPVPEIIALNRRIENDWRKQYKTRIMLDIPAAFKSLEFSRTSGCCFCGIKNILGVLASTKLAMCGIGEKMESLTFGNADEVRLEEVWKRNEVLTKLRSELPNELEGICRICMMKHYCMGRCRANVAFTTGSLTAPYTFCQEAYEAGSFPASRIYES